METPFLFPIEPNDFFSRLKQVIDKSINDKLQLTQVAVSQNGLTTKPLLSLKEVCELFQITKPTVYDWIEHEKLKPYKVRGRVFFLLSDIQMLIQSSADIRLK
ncbi:MAG: helix-turn-helix domain-containing protein [Sediminibacterium sp.]|nr:helix-turn-helix domain-containing protein [Sediminibacterium sp.]